ncbi:CarboxypepD_reg-like domain-containing protein [Mesonia phycicola]|uniref:CarboxypepD_reg-like domain-containing protein n=1 Tax=Mesonia phycicola TaxID=579105 RepID=A0A1M6HAT4_9FLAO|nr:carboxypeptidase-like regulatory domain-containing protein [Mesonia phycicola]SHJ19342.1 CarboxypepD_reg-like domain-containing protein [Mesonia phycicola]
MKKLPFLLILLISNFTFSQIQSVIVNNNTKEVIPYVNIWVENEDIGTTSNNNGEFELNINNSKTIIFSAIGFETKKIISDSIKSVITLNPTVTQLEEVIIQNKLETKEISIGKFKKSKIDFYYSTGKKPWIVARFFKYQEAYKNTPFLNKINVLTNSDIDNAKFNIRLYSIDSNGEPDEYIYQENIIGTAEKGKNITEVDVSNLNIQFPKEGFFVAIEWLIVDANKRTYEYNMYNSDEKRIGYSYEPSIGTIPSETNEDNWIFHFGKWRKREKNISTPKKINYSKRYRDKYNSIAVELILTN